MNRTRMGLVGLLAGFLLTSCLSFGARSTGATLPQTADSFDDGELKVKLDHDCSGGRCRGFSAEFTNMTDSPIEIVSAGSKISRAGESFAIQRTGEQKGNLVIPPKATVEGTYRPVNRDGRYLTYTKATSVWCSLKVDDECKNPSKGEAMCAGFARYYHQSYISAGGWITVEISYKTPWKTSLLTTLPPQFSGEPPSIQLTSDTDSPGWYASSGAAVLHKITCDETCRCTDVEKRRNFFVDERFLPAMD